MSPATEKPQKNHFGATIPAAKRHPASLGSAVSNGVAVHISVLKRRVLLSLAALSPGVVTLALQEFAVSVAFMVLGLFGAIGVAIVAVAASPQMKDLHETSSARKASHPSLLTASAMNEIREKAPNPVVIRASLRTLMKPQNQMPGFVTDEEKIAMVLSQIMARWGHSEPTELSDDQARELWLVEQLMRATPAEAGALASCFTAPNAMLTMRDRIVNPVPA